MIQSLFMTPEPEIDTKGGRKPPYKKVNILQDGKVVEIVENASVIGQSLTGYKTYLDKSIGDRESKNAEN